MQETHKEATTLMGDHLELNIVPENEDADDEYNRFSVSYRELCGYFSVSFKFKTEEAAQEFFKAAQHIVDYEAG